MSDWDAWIGREEQRTDLLDEALAARWNATFMTEGGYRFDLPKRMPQGIHFALCTPDAATVDLGEDGHPKRDDGENSFFPPIPLPRRMWASSKIEFLAPLKLGARIERTSRIASVAEKDGSTGKLGFVDVEHVTRADGEEAIREVQTLVYRDVVASDAPLSPPEPGDGAFDASEWDTVKTIVPSEALLFRFSALTFNTHRIHYDLRYARDVERYRGLVVHGPLIASLLLKRLSAQFGTNRVLHFNFRAVSPAIAGEPLHLAMRQSDEGYELGSFASDGRQTLKAGATL